MKTRSDIKVVFDDASNKSDRGIALRAWAVHPDECPPDKNDTVDGWRRVIKAMMKGRHGCYDSMTEVLTNEGWKFWPDVRGDELFLTINHHTDIMEWQKAERLVRKPVKEDMIRLKMNSVDLLVTQDHNMLACRRVHSSEERYELVPAHEFQDRCHRIRMGGGDWVGESQTDDLPFRLIGFFIGDGHCKNGQRLEFHLRRVRKIKYLSEIVSDGDCGMGVEQKAGDRYVVAVPSHIQEVFAGCYDSKGEKQIPSALLNLPVDQLADLFDGLINSDGSVSKSGKTVYSTTSRKLADQIQELALKIGKAAVIQLHRLGNGTTHKTLWRVTIYRERNARPRVGWTTSSRRKEVTKEYYEGDVHCVTVPNGTLYVRRNGIPCWCGNTPFEGGYLSVYVEAPIVVWWEWTRHRFMSLGCPDLGFNLESGRYKVLEGEFYLPPEGRPCKEPDNFKPMRPVLEDDVSVALIAKWSLKDAYADCWDSYQQMVNRSVSREVARLALPFGIYYAGYVSANPRTWLQFFSLRRNDPDAAVATYPQWEIANADEQVERMFAERWPITYQQFQEQGRVAP